MANSLPKCVSYSTVELGGVRYAILPEAFLREVCRRAAVRAAPACERAASSDNWAEVEQFDAQTLAERLAARRKRAGLAQAELARRAGVRVETLNRVERGRVTPDFATIRKLVTVIQAAEAEASERPEPASNKA